MRILLDQNSPKGLAALLVGHEVSRAAPMGWAELDNGELLAAAEAAGFDLMITGDQNLRYQHNLAGRRIALAVLSTNNWLVVRNCQQESLACVEQAGKEGYAELNLPRPPLKRRRRPLPC